MKHRIKHRPNLLSLHSKRPQRQRGFTLIEILVSIIILSFGLLGMVGIQALALKSNADAKLQSSAVRLGKELAEMMRGNKKIALQTAAQGNPYLVEYTSIPDTLANTEPCFSDGAALCTTPLKVAQWEIKDWLTRVNAEFPKARVKVCLDEKPYDGNGIPQWDCTNTGDIIAIKIGWVRETTNKTRVNTGNLSADNTTNSGVAFDQATKPSVIYSVTPGSTE